MCNLVHVFLSCNLVHGFFVMQFGTWFFVIQFGSWFFLSCNLVHGFLSCNFVFKVIYMIYATGYIGNVRHIVFSFSTNNKTKLKVQCIIVVVDTISSKLPSDRPNNHSRSRELRTFLYDVADL